MSFQALNSEFLNNARLWDSQLLLLSCGGFKKSKTNNIIRIIVIIQISSTNAIIVIIMASFIRIVITISFYGSSISMFCQRPLNQFGLGK